MSEKNQQEYLIDEIDERVKKLIKEAPPAPELSDTASQALKPEVGLAAIKNAFGSSN